MTELEKKIYEYAICNYENEKMEMRDEFYMTGGMTERCVEVPWVAKMLKKYKVDSLLDVGFTFASHDYLRLILDYAKEHQVEGTDIISPEKVESRYPENWLPEIRNIRVHINNIAEQYINKQYDAVTIISTLEHVGYDKVSVTIPNSAFERAESPENVNMNRAEGIEASVLNNICEMLKPGGYVILSVPAGQGGSILLQDSLNLYTCEWEYEKESIKKIVEHDKFICVEKNYYKCDENGIWKSYADIDNLRDVTARMKRCAAGVACCVLKRK